MTVYRLMTTVLVLASCLLLFYSPPFFKEGWPQAGVVSKCVVYIMFKGSENA